MASKDDDEKPGIKWKPPTRFIRDDDDPEEEWGMEHCKILYMISKFAREAVSATDKESWLRQVPMIVLMFEGIRAEVIDLDYAPCSMLVSDGGRSRRVWLNISQEGKSAVDDLREGRMINGLKLSTEDFQPVTAFQVSAKGLEFLKILPMQCKNEVDKFVYTKAKDGGELLEVEFDATANDGDGAFFLSNSSGTFKQESEVTESEDVSYVSSPYIPQVLRKEGRFQIPFTSNAHRAHEAAQGESQIKDELEEAIILSDVMAMVGEWIPFGSNQIVALNERLGALDRCQGGLFTAMVDENPTDTQFSVPPGLTSVKILDFDFVRFINFEAEINYPEDDGVVQIENFGMHLNVDGTIIYGIMVEAILARQKDDISLDMLSRLLVDLHQDSSAIMNDLLSQYQRNLLDMTFMGDADKRNKFNCIVAQGVTPKVSGEDYMDKGDLENELKQVLGDLRACHDLGDKDVIMQGQDGVLLCGPHARNHEQLMCAYLSLLVREIFIRNFFVRTFVLDDLLDNIRRLIVGYTQDPNHVSRIRSKLNVASRDVIMMNEVLAYLQESLQEFRCPATPEDLNGKRLFKVLEPAGMQQNTMIRCQDLNKLMEGSAHQLKTLQLMTEVINTKQLEDVFRGVESNTKYLVDASAASERASASLEVMQIILAGSFAFDIMDRISGGTLNIEVPTWVEDIIVKYFISVPGLWWVINMVWLLVLCWGLLKYMAYLGGLAAGFITVRAKVGRKINVEMLEAYLNSKDITVADTVHDPTQKIKKVQWTEDDANLYKMPGEKKGAPPSVEIVYDQQYEFLLHVTLSFDAKKTKAREQDMLQIFLNELKTNKALFNAKPLVSIEKK